MFQSDSFVGFTMLKSGNSTINQLKKSSDGKNPITSQIFHRVFSLSFFNFHRYTIFKKINLQLLAGNEKKRKNFDMNKTFSSRKSVVQCAHNPK